MVDGDSIDHRVRDVDYEHFLRDFPNYIQVQLAVMTQWDYDTAVERGREWFYKENFFLSNQTPVDVYLSGDHSKLKKFNQYPNWSEANCM
jgi:hypothetical protein